MQGLSDYDILDNATVEYIIWMWSTKTFNKKSEVSIQQINPPQKNMSPNKELFQ